jgi:hypothetical protein
LALLFNKNVKREGMLFGLAVARIIFLIKGFNTFLIPVNVCNLPFMGLTTEFIFFTRAESVLKKIR